MSLIDGIGIGGYRSFGTEQMGHFGPLLKVNFIAGQNNAGKSNLLRFLHAVLAGTAGSADTETTGQWDRPLGDPEHRFRFAVGVPWESIESHPLIQGLQDGNRQTFLSEVKDMSALAAAGSDLAWWQYSNSELNHLNNWHLDQVFLSEAVDQASGALHSIARSLSSQHLGRSGGAHGDDFVRILESIAPNRASLPESRTLVGIRQILNDGDENAEALSGLNLVRRLRALQNPAMDSREDRVKFDAITEFARVVLEDDSVVIDIPHDLSAILVTRNGSTLPLENLGTGVHEVIIIAAAATIVENSIVCIEEPELHLHPLLQRKLVRYLASATSNQYFVATHSAHMLDSNVGSIFHVKRSSAGSEVTYAGLPRDRAAICADLGYQPSDIVQANCILWVEGPSDRIYLRRWISIVDDTLIEGVHFSIMFYGGRLLSHLSPNDSDVEDFISLRSMNRRMAILIDSDKTSSGKQLNATKQRVQSDFQTDGLGFAWVTAGYTIENYVPIEMLDESLDRASDAPALSPYGRWENPLLEGRLGSKPDKVKVAHRVAGAWTSETVGLFDLNLQVNNLVRFVKDSNQI